VWIPSENNIPKYYFQTLFLFSSLLCQKSSRIPSENKNIKSDLPNCFLISSLALPKNFSYPLKIRFWNQIFQTHTENILKATKIFIILESQNLLRHGRPLVQKKFPSVADRKLARVFVTKDWQKMDWQLESCEFFFSANQEGLGFCCHSIGSPWKCLSPWSGSISERNFEPIGKRGREIVNLRTRSSQGWQTSQIRKIFVANQPFLWNI